MHFSKLSVARTAILLTVLAIAVFLSPNSARSDEMQAFKYSASGSPGTYGNDQYDQVGLVYTIKLGEGFDPTINYSVAISTTREGTPGGTPVGPNVYYLKDADRPSFSVLQGQVCNGDNAPQTVFLVDDHVGFLSYTQAQDRIVISGDGNLYDGNGAVVGWVTPFSETITFTGIAVLPPAPVPPRVIRYISVPITINYGAPKNATDCPKVKTELRSVDVTIPIGDDEYGKRNAALMLSASLPNPYLSNPSSLTATAGTNTEVIRTNGVLRQIRTPNVLADIVTNSFTNKYEVRLYHTNDVAASKDTNNLWVPTGTAYKTVTIENPGGSASSNQLFVTEADGSVTNLSKYTWDNTNTWTFEPPGGLGKETLTMTWDTNQVIRTELHSILETNNTLVFQEQKKIQILPWGEQLVEQVIDPSGARLTNSWSYYTNSGSPGYGLIKERSEGTGFWERFEYIDASRVTNRVSAYLNATNGAPASQSRQTVTSYSGSNPRVTEIDYVLGNEVGRRYQAWAANQIQSIQSQTPGALLSASDNLTNIIDRYSSGAFAGEVQRVCRPDGIAALYEYSISNNQKITTVSQGLTNSAGTNILEGLKTTTVVALTGETISRVVTNITGGTAGILLSSESYSYDSSDYFKRSPRIRLLDGTTNQINWSCCHLDNTVDSDGTITSYTFDPLNRPTSVTRNSITLSNVYNAAGNVIKAIRVGSDSSMITLSKASYDTAGRKTSETNALNGGTTISDFYDTSIQLIRTNTYPDGGQRIETYYRDGALQKVSGSAIHGVRYEYGVSTGTSTNRFRKEIKLNTDGTDSSEFSTNFVDMVGRNYKTVYADNASSVSSYNNFGQLIKFQDPDGVVTLYQYNGKGELEYTATDLNQNGSIDWTSDRLVRNVRDVTTINSVDVNRVRTYAFMQNGSAASNLVAETWDSTDGRQSWSIRFGLTNQVGILFAGSGYRVTTNTAPDGSFSVRTNYQGQLTSVTRRDAGGSQLGQTRCGYDYQGRQVVATDARTGTQSYGYNNADQVTLALTTSPGNGQNPQSTSFTYDTQGRVTATSLPDGGSVSNDYLLTGELRRTSGTRTYPVGYSYDYQGRLKTMTNWSTFSGLTGPRVTTWNYSTNRGFLISKTYPDSQGPSYTYTSAGRRKTRVWARGITTTYTNNAAGDLIGTGYSDGITTNVVLTLDRVGRPTSIIDGAGTHDLTLHDSGLVLLENNSSGLLSGLNITNAYDARLRRTSLFFRNNSTIQFTHSYGYDAASRMTNVSDGTYSAAYSYLANSPLVSQIGFYHGSTNRMTTTKAYDYLNRLTQISSTPSGPSQTPFTFSYGQNDANQRVNVGLADNSHWVYEYDSLGQVTSGKRYWSDGTPVAGQQFEYSFDDIGNRTSTRAGGDSGGASLRSATYGANTLNQYTNRTVSGTSDVLGIAHALATTTVNTASTYRKGEYFQKALTADNSTGAVYQAVTVQAVYLGATNSSTGSVFLAKSPENFTYDADGNLTSDGRWTNRWDAENRLMEMQPISGIPAGAKKILHFNYDARGRRVSKTVSNWTGTAWALSYDNRFVYDNWNLIAEVNKTNNTVVCSYMWGLDLSRTFKGAGGVGGLLTVSPAGNGTHFAAFDGNGNVIGLVDGSTGTNSANYEYGPFGETIRLSGSVASLNSVLGGTKYTDNESGIVVYPYRIYNPSFGGWLSRDPIGERGGLGLYGYVSNDPIDTMDPDGLAQYRPYDYNNRIPNAVSIGLGGTLSAVDGYPLTPNEPAAKAIAAAALFAFTAGAATPALAEAGLSGPILAAASGSIGGAYGNLTVQAVELGAGERTSIDWGQFGQATVLAGLTAGTLDKVSRFLVRLPCPTSAAKETTQKFFSVQSDADAARLASGGAPWPTGLQRANLGEGLYAWGTLADAEAYAAGKANVQILQFEMSEANYSTLKTLDVRSLSDEAATSWLDTYSQYGQGLPHGFDHVIRGTGSGVEYYFSPDAFKLFN